MSTKSNNYGRFAKVYELLSVIYSGGAIEKVKKDQSLQIQAGEKVLFAGAGTGSDVIMAAKREAQVTVVELAPAMMSVLREKLVKENLLNKVTLITKDIMDYNNKSYDKVVANFFLNVFDNKTMVSVLKHLTSLVTKNGELIIGDFAPPSSNKALRLFQKLYFGFAASVFVLTAGNGRHPLYDYESVASKIGLKLKKKRYFSLGPISQVYYSTTYQVS